MDLYVTVTMQYFFIIFWDIARMKLNFLQSYAVL